ncbi:MULTISPECIES: pyrimidine dimer DNA glycosylase/endonuclease V [unclassified Dietzia]|uniref:pyrimidine dimer DNA glycosylase/endonuclease V n=1 Tax=unclassified Dietzia TaxID=2617939 RepID=UPI000D20CAA3|nr:hypothetical protein CT688_15955 [Dietzia sp. JS16-p6b]QGW26325.1 Pyrimidine dimer DNA glycosylase /DNA- lyase [Dietzia sp. DQ12-45-1b]
MRLWSIHPDLPDRAALVAGWREGLLAQKGLGGHPGSYHGHPPSGRFRTVPHSAFDLVPGPLAAGRRLSHPEA